MKITLSSHRPKSIRKDALRTNAMAQHEFNVTQVREIMRNEIKILRAEGKDNEAFMMHKDMVRL